MMPHATAFELSRQRLAEAVRRADFATHLGELPKPEGLRLFRRQVISLPGIVEVRSASEKERIRRRLTELSAAAPARSERRAS
jgi:hypothetical protein